VLPNRGDKAVTACPGRAAPTRSTPAAAGTTPGITASTFGHRRVSRLDAPNLWERNQVSRSSLSDFEDGKLNIPENKNKVTDLLDEARWEIDFRAAHASSRGRKAGRDGPHRSTFSNTSSARARTRTRWSATCSRAARRDAELAANAAQARGIWRRSTRLRRQVPNAGERAGPPRRPTRRSTPRPHRRRWRIRRQERRRRLLLGCERASTSPPARQPYKVSSPKSSYFKKVNGDGTTTPACTRR